MCDHQNALDLLGREFLAVGIGVQYGGSRLDQIKQPQAVELVAVHIPLRKDLERAEAGEKGNEHIPIRIGGGDQFHLYASIRIGLHRIFADDIHIAFDQGLQEQGSLFRVSNGLPQQFVKIHRKLSFPSCNIQGGMRCRFRQYCTMHIHCISAMRYCLIFFCCRWCAGFA